MDKRDINDKLREFIIWAIECYEVAAHPPAVNYSRRVDINYRDDVNGYSRAYLLRLGIDTKYALSDLLGRIPLNRANVLMGWVTKEETYYWHNLTYKQQFFLKIDRNELINRLRGNKTSPRATPQGVT
jgi:hypothetical protein